jgi:uncharacterized repeat protein (TIGR03803 family)
MRISAAFTFVLLLVGFVGLAGLAAHGQKLTTLYTFCAQGTDAPCNDGAAPDASLIQGSDGNFYGTTIGGGLYGEGTVFRVTPSGTLTTIYSFCKLGGADCTDGAQPQGGVIEGSDGNFYGTTSSGGIPQTYDLCNLPTPFTCGTVFKLTPSGELTTLHSFCSQVSSTNGCLDGANPNGLVLGSDGNFYGTAPGGNAGGTIFEISPSGTFNTVYAFCEQVGCTYGPGGLVLGSDGNFYGATGAGYGESIINGSVFKLTPGGVLTNLAYFCNVSGCLAGGSPASRLVEGSDGNFYGTTTEGELDGSVFRVAPTGGGTTLHLFCSLADCADGAAPYGGLIQGTDGNFYGTTYLGGGGAQSECISGVYGCGTIFKISPTTLTLTTLHSFCNGETYPDCTDGALPIAGLVQATDFNFYGVTGGLTESGPNVGQGVFFVLAALPVARVSPAKLTFASQDEGTTSSSQPVTLKNAGHEALTVSSVVASGDFSETDNCVGSLAVGRSCTVNVFFEPTQTGARTGSLTITDNNVGINGSQQTVSLTGTGANPGASLSATTLAFGNEGINTTSLGKKVTLTSSGTTPLNNISVAIIGPNQSDFLQTSTCPAKLNVGAKCAITVTFTPSLLAAESATLQVTDSAANSPQTIALSGTGVADTTFTPTSEKFGDVLQGTSSTARTFDLKNNQSTAVSISEMTFTGTNQGDFSQTGGTCGTSLAAKESCTILVTFTPSVLGAESATLSVTSNAEPPYNSLTSTLSGTGIAQAAVSPTSINYGTQKVGTTSSARNVTLKNNLSSALTISPFSFTGADPGDFNVSTTTCGASLAANSTCTISIVFTPTATGGRAATLNVNDSANNSPQTVSLTGAGD